MKRMRLKNVVAAQAAADPVCQWLQRRDHTAFPVDQRAINVDCDEHWSRDAWVLLAFGVVGAVCRMGYFRPALDVPFAPSVLCNVGNYWVDPLGLNTIQRNRPHQQEEEKL